MNDLVLVGREMVERDDFTLTVLMGMKNILFGWDQPVRVIIDPDLKLLRPRCGGGGGGGK